MRQIIAAFLLLSLSACASPPPPSLLPPTDGSTLVTAIPATVGDVGNPSQPVAIPTRIQSTIPTKNLVAYYTAWSIYAPQYYVTDIPADLVTHLNYAFMNISDDGECILGDQLADVQFQYVGDQEGEQLLGNFKQLRLLKQNHSNLKILFSVGGWTWSDKFSDVALTDVSRQRFAQSCVALMRQYGFDGIDIDWEVPVGGGLAKDSGRPEDKANLTLLLAELRHQLDVAAATDSKSYLLTIAIPAMPDLYANFELGNIAPFVDWINIMAYAYHGGWGPITHHQAPLYYSTHDPAPSEATRPLNVDATVQAFLAAGVPSDKIVIGIPFYGQGWRGVPDGNGGLYQTLIDLPDGTRGDGVYDYSALVDGSLGDVTRYWDDEAKVPWLYDPANQIMISYENPDSVATKADYAVAHHLGGVMVWELSFDDDQNTLLHTLADHLSIHP